MPQGKEFSKGSCELILLKLLSRGDMHGYQLVGEMALLSNNVFSMSQGSLYPLLHTMEAKGYLSSYEKGAEGRRRRMYHLTGTGKRALAQQENRWRAYVSSMEDILREGEPEWS